MTKKQILDFYNKLHSHYGAQHWWPGDSPFEICIGAILTQNTSWDNVEKAIANMKREGILSVKGINECNSKRLARIIKPSGYFNVKAKKLKAFTRHLRDSHLGSLKRLFQAPTPELRRELLSIWGVGNETADSMLCYAADRPVFVMDAYTKRIAERFYGEKFAGYSELQSFFTSKLKPDTRLFNEFHALFVAHGKDTCTKSRPKCAECPINKNCCYYKH